MVLRRVGFATAEPWTDITPSDRIAAAALEARGVEVVPVVWSRSPRPTVDALVVRATWDYYRRPAEFSAWLAELEQSGVPVYNPVPVLRWSMDKRYLRELEQKGICVAATAWGEEDDSVKLTDLLEERGWDDVVVKPTVSASGWRTFRSNPSRAHEDEAAFELTRSTGSFMIQPFIPMIAAEGEWSLIYIAGRYSHAVLKKPAGGGFMVQPEHGGRSEAAIPTSYMLQAAERILAAAPGPTLYARVDGVRDGRNFVLTELELLEPHLFFELRPQAAAEFAEALQDSGSTG
jgi:glutathione synthase/RimK-type ligase-like ATP-grasp enzyme